MITLIQQSYIDFPNLLNELYKLLGKSATETLDRERNSKTQLNIFLEILSNLRGKSASREYDILRQLTIGFLVSNVDRSIPTAICTKTDLNVFIHNHFFLVSGDLYSWRQAFITCTEDERFLDLVYCFNNFYLEFEKLELSLCTKCVKDETYFTLKP